MKRLFLAGLLATAFISTPAMAARDKIYMPNDLRAKISAYIGQKKVTSATLKSPVKRGRKFEDGVALLDVPADWGTDLAKYKYVYSDNRVLFIEPSSRKVVDTIKVTP
jgi:hypothetical protein